MILWVVLLLELVCGQRLSRHLADSLGADAPCFGTDAIREEFTIHRQNPQIRKVNVTQGYGSYTPASHSVHKRPTREQKQKPTINKRTTRATPTRTTNTTRTATEQKQLQHLPAITRLATPTGQVLGARSARCQRGNNSRKYSSAKLLQGPLHSVEVVNGQDVGHFPGQFLLQDG